MPPKSVWGAPCAVVLGVVDSAGLLVPPKRPPLGAAGAAPPNNGLGVLDVEAVLAAPPKRPPEACGCEAAGVVKDKALVDGVVEEVEVMPPKRLGFDPGGGPAGVVELLPNKEPPAGAGVADEGVLPKRLLPPDPNVEPPADELGSDGFPGVPKRAWPPLLV